MYWKKNDMCLGLSARVAVKNSNEMFPTGEASKCGSICNILVVFGYSVAIV